MDRIVFTNVAKNDILIKINKSKEETEMKQRKVIHDLTEGPLFRQVVAFTVPFVIANLLQTLYTITDLAIVGHCTQSGALAAVSVSGQVTMLMTIVGNMIASGGQIFIAQMVGQRRTDELSRTAGNLLLMSLALSMIFVIGGTAFSGVILGWLNTPDEAFSAATDYLGLCSAGMIFVFGYNAVFAILRGMGESRAPSVFIAITAALNVVGDLLLVLVFDMGAMGAAIATVASQGIAFLLSVRFLYRRREQAHFDFSLSNFRPDREKLRVMLRLALPLIAMQLAINISMLYVSSFINAYGVAAASCSGVGNKMFSVVSVVSSAFNASLATIVGQNVAAGRYDRTKKSLYIGLFINLLFFALVAFFVLVFPESVFRVFTNDADVLAMARPYLRIAVWAYLGFALMHPALGLITGVGNTVLNMVIGILDGVVARIGLSLLLGTKLGVWGYFWGFSLAGFVSVILAWIYVFSGRWKKRRLVTE